MLKALTDLQHAFARALELALDLDDGECSPSMDMMTEFDYRMEEIRQMKREVGGRYEC
jgi:hypothetical protein